MENHRKAEKDAKTVRKSFRFLLTKAAPCAIIRLLRLEDHGNDGTSTREKASTESAVDTLKDTRCFPGEDHSRAACDEQVVRPATEGTSAEYAERVKRQGGTVPLESNIQRTLGTKIPGVLFYTPAASERRKPA